MTHDFPALVEILLLHASLIDEFGGTPGIRDQNALESALLRPQTALQPWLEEHVRPLPKTA